MEILQKPMSKRQKIENYEADKKIHQNSFRNYSDFIAHSTTKIPFFYKKITNHTANGQQKKMVRGKKATR